MTGEPSKSEPLSIWFFVGVILSIYGVLVVLSDFLPHERATVLAQIRPALWWGAITTVCGAVFLAIGVRQVRRSRKNP
jgi:drug/metabolite transporter (DMT)-like permease